jgi:hypothetical protein
MTRLLVSVKRTICARLIYIESQLVQSASNIPESYDHAQHILPNHRSVSSSTSLSSPITVYKEREMTEIYGR